MRKKGKEWKVTFKDPAAKDKAKETLYVFFTQPTIPACPSCALENTYPDGDNYVCADCGHEWPMVEAADAMVKDANGTSWPTAIRPVWPRCCAGRTEQAKHAASNCQTMAVPRYIDIARTRIS